MSGRKFCAKLLKLMGWTVDDPQLPTDKKLIILGAPHTSIWDFIVAWLFYYSIGGWARCMVKKELFFFPLGWILRKIGAIPIDRKNSTSIIRSVISEIEKSDNFCLAIAPEGTRKPVRRWKTGFHLIARATGLPVYMGYFNWDGKHIGYGKKVELTDDAAADMRRIQQLYEDMNMKGKFNENYLTK